MRRKSRNVIILENEIDSIVLKELLALDCLRKVVTAHGERIVITPQGRGFLKVLEQQLKPKHRRPA